MYTAVSYTHLNDSVDRYMDEALASGNLEDSYELWKKAQWDGTAGVTQDGDIPWIWLVNIDPVSYTHLDVYKRQEPGYARGMGLKTRATIEEALADARKKFVGQNPNILALPQTFKLGAVHLMMKDEAYEGKGQEDCGCACHMHGKLM